MLNEAMLINYNPTLIIIKNHKCLVWKIKESVSHTRQDMHEKLMEVDTNKER